VAPHLIEILGREREPVRLAIIEALAELKQPIAEPPLVRLLADPAVPIRCAAMKALARFASDGAMRQAVAVCARDTSWRVRAEMAQLVPTEMHGATAALERLSVDANSYVADVARRRLAAHA
jgi:HEAT repeat protein